MAFTDFKSIQQVQTTYNIKYVEEDYIFYDELKPSVSFLEDFAFSQQNIDIYSSEASRCENVIYPIIKDIYKHYADKYSLWSHKLLSYDSVLTGIPDYIISTKSILGKTVLGIPITIVVEAKKNDFIQGWGQCLAELIAIQKINKNETKEVHGIVTDGELWQFGKLMKSTFTKNRTVLVISEINKIFAAINYLIKLNTKT